MFEPGGACAGTVVETLKTGDYSLRGYEHLLAVERKGSACEFVQNITHKEKWECFRAELERLEEIPAAFVVLEFTFEEVSAYPKGSNLPWAVRRKVRVSPQFYVKRLVEIQMEFRARLFFAGAGRGRDFVSSLFKRVVERWPSPV